jgi:hypothetical protein
MEPLHHWWGPWSVPFRLLKSGVQQTPIYFQPLFVNVFG